MELFLKFLLMLQVFVTKAAMKASPGIAVLFFQLDERLRIGCMGGFDPRTVPHAGNVVIFGFEFFQKCQGTFAQAFVAPVLTVSIQERSDRINQDQVQTFVADGFAPAGRAPAEQVMGFPIG